MLDVRVNFARPRPQRGRYYSPRMGSGRDVCAAQARATACALALFAGLATGSSHAADLIWEVENPFRFFKRTRSFALHEAAFNAVRGDPSAPLPADIIWRTERALNDPDCKDASSPDRCAATAGKRYQQSRLGWAAQTLDDTCYESNGRRGAIRRFASADIPGARRRKITSCPRRTRSRSGSRPSNSPGVTGDCTWTWQPRKAGGKTESKRIACKDKLTIARVPYSLDRASPASRSR